MRSANMHGGGEGDVKPTNRRAVSSAMSVFRDVGAGWRTLPHTQLQAAATTDR